MENSFDVSIELLNKKIAELNIIRGELAQAKELATDTQHAQPEKCPKCEGENIGGIGNKLRICGDCYHRWGIHQASAQ